VPGQPGSLDFEVALGSITAQDVMMKRQRMGLADYDGTTIYYKNTPFLFVQNVYISLISDLNQLLLSGICKFGPD